MSNMLAGFAAGYILFARIFVAVLGAVAIVWGLLTIPIFWRQAAIEHVARHIVRGESYRIEVLRQQLPAVEAAESSTICRPIALWSATIIRLRMFEQANHDGQGTPNDLSRMATLDNSIRRSLSCSAAEPFLWLVLYGLETRQDGSEQKDFRYLRMSYQLGPNEGWISVKRNPVSFADYDRLPLDLETNAVIEFLSLIKSELYQQAADILSGPAWRLRASLLPWLATLPLRSQEAFVKTVYDRGLDVKIPGFIPMDSKRQLDWQPESRDGGH